jgi:pyrophosphatase PpaX
MTPVRGAGSIPPDAAARAYRAVLFDLDGTLVDSADLIIAAFQETVAARLHRRVSRAEVLATWSRPIRERFHALAPDRDEALSREYLRRYLALRPRYARLFPGVGAVLETLAGRGYALGIVTSKRRATAWAEVTGFRLDRWCTATVAEEDVRRHKPDGEPVRTACARLGVPVEAALMVGDSALDIDAGRNAGAGTAGALWGAVDRAALLDAAPDHRLRRPEDLLALCPERKAV